MPTIGLPKVKQQKPATKWPALGAKGIASSAKPIERLAKHTALIRPTARMIPREMAKFTTTEIALVAIQKVVTVSV